MINPQNPDYQNTPVCSLRPAFDYQPKQMNARAVVTIITPFYNTGIVFEETAKSILQQSLQQWEWIIVNDGSTEQESLDLLRTYRAIDPRIRVIDHPLNQGLPSARNTGARSANSKYLLFIDSDDLLEPTAAEKWLWFLDSHPQLSFAGGYSVGFGAHEYLWQSGFQDLEANLEENRINHVVMMRKETWEAVGGYDESFRQGLEDWDFWVRSANMGYWGNSVTEYLHWYRTRKDHTDRWLSLNREQKEALKQDFRRRYPQLMEGAFPHFQHYVDLQLTQMREDLPAENFLKKNKKRLLLIVPWLIIGGAEKFNLDLLKQLVAQGWEVTLVTTTPAENVWQHEYEKLTPDVFPLPNFIEVSDYPRFLVYLINSRNYDAVVVTSSHEAYRLLPYLRFHFPNLPIVDYLHFVTPNWMDGGYPRLSLLFHSFIDISIVTSDHLKNWMVSQGGDEETIMVCTANVDTDYWKPNIEKRLEVRSKMGMDDNQTIILYVGRIENQKQPNVFAKTIRQLSEHNLPFTAVVIGEGSLKGWLETYIQSNKFEDKVLFTGGLSQAEVRDWMAAGDIIFLPSENEGIALTIYEGMAAGLAVVAANVGGQRELVTAECGYLLPRGSEDDEAVRYAEVLETLIRDPEARQRMGKASRERVAQHFRLDQMGERMVALLHTAERLRIEKPGEMGGEEYVRLNTRQSVEYLSLMNHYRFEVSQLKITNEQQKAEIQRLFHTMPPASADTYFYFTVRQLLYPLMKQSTGQGWLEKLKSAIKKRLFKVSP